MTWRVLVVMLVCGGLLLILMGTFDLIRIGNPMPTPSPTFTPMQLPTR